MNSEGPVKYHVSASLLPAALGLLALAGSAPAREQSGAPLPLGVKAVWDSAKAWHETTPTRERLCINGLWRWQPAASDAREVPTAGWGYFKVPACWPGIQDYMQSDYQTLYPDPTWKGAKLGEVRSAWYERTISIPQGWAGRRIGLEVEYLNSYAAVYVDGHQVGQIRFPAGQVDLSAVVRPGATHVLSLLVVAMPLRAVMESVQRHQHRPAAAGQSGTSRALWRCLACQRADWGAACRTSGSIPLSAKARLRSTPGCRGCRRMDVTSCGRGSWIRADRWRNLLARRSLPPK